MKNTLLMLALVPALTSAFLFNHTHLNDQPKFLTINKDGQHQHQSRKTPVKVEIYYSPYNEKANKFIASQNKDSAFSIYDLMLPGAGGSTVQLEVDYIPWGVSTKTDPPTVTYDCGKDDNCLAHKLHACLVRHHDTTIENHHEFLMVLCTTQHPDWPTNPTSAITKCAIKVNDIPDGGEQLVTCANDAVQSAEYLDEMKAKTDLLSSPITEDSIPTILIDGVANPGAVNNLRKAVCQQFGPDAPIACSNIKVEIYYSPYNQKAIDFVSAQNKDSPTGIYDLMLPGATGIGPGLEVDYIPWGVSTATGVSPTLVFDCTDDANCLAHKLHACLLRHHDTTINNHHEFLMVLCTTQHPDWKSDPNHAITHCAEEVNDIPDGGEQLVICAKDAALSGQYLDEMRVKTLGLIPKLEEKDIPLIHVNGEPNTGAVANLKKVVCDLFGAKGPVACRPKVKVEVYYSPYNPKAIDFILDQSLASPKGIYDLMIPARDGSSMGVEVDYIPWGMSTSNGATPPVYNCGTDDVGCFAHRLHACLVRHHDTTIDNHHEFLMVLCTTQHPDWKTKPTNAITQCAQKVNDIPGDGEELVICAKDNKKSGEYLDEMRVKTQELKPAITDTDIPLIYVDGERNTEAADNLRAVVCNKFGVLQPLQCKSGFQVNVEVYYSPDNQEAIKFIAKHQKSEKDSIWDIMHPGAHAPVKIDFIPWGVSTRTESTQPDTANTYTCDPDANCLKHRLHACIERHHTIGLENHHEFYMIVCTTNHGDWSTDPGKATNQCADQVNDIPEDGPALVVCGHTPVQSDQYLDEMYDLTKQAVPQLTAAEIPVVLVNGVGNTDALDKLRSVVCSTLGSNAPPVCKPLEVFVYYSPYDKDSIRLLSEQAENLHKGIYDLIVQSELVQVDIDFIPWGLSTKTDSALYDSRAAKYECTNEHNIHYVGCLVTRLHACIRHHYTNKQQLYQMIVCTTSDGDWEKNPEGVVMKCGNNLPDKPFDGKKITDCAESAADSDPLLDEVKALTDKLNPKLTKTPYITIDGILDENGGKNLRDTVCESFNENYIPDECKVTPGAVVVEVYYSPNDPKAVDFIIRQREDSQKGIYDLMQPSDDVPVEVDFIPWGVSVKHPNGSYGCQDDPDCTLHRIHACIERHTGAGFLNHHEFNMIVCTVFHDNWATDPTKATIECGNELTDGLPDSGVTIVECATHTDESNIYLDHMLEKTSQLSPILTNKDIPLIVINGDRGDDATQESRRDNLRTAVCDAFPGNKPDGCKPIDITGVKVEIYYSPYNPAAIDHIKQQIKDSEYGIYDLMHPDLGLNLEVDYIPWGLSTAETTGDGDNKKVVYKCNGEKDCLATRLHACIQRHHEDSIENHHEFYMIVCTTTHEKWRTDPTVAAAQCGERVDDIPEDGTQIVNCATTTTISDPFLDEMKNKTQLWLPNLRESDIPVVKINGKTNGLAGQNLRTAVCHAYGDDAPAICTKLPPVSVRVEVYYSPYNGRAIEFINRQRLDSLKGVYDMMIPQPEGEPEIDLEIDFVPWGISTRLPGNKPQYTCADDDLGCMAHRLHACIERHHSAGLENHHEFLMVLCTTTHPDWKSNPTHAVEQCALQVNDIPEDGVLLVECAKDIQLSNRYLNDMLEKTGHLSPPISQEDIPVILINNERNTGAFDNLRSAVCTAFGTNAPAACKITLNNVKVEILYSPYNTRALDFLKQQQKSSSVSIWDLMDPDLLLPIEIDYIPWGVSVKTGSDYTCSDNDKDCLAHRIHACIEHHHDSSLENHQEFRMIVCTANHGEWLTNATHTVMQCANQESDIPDTGVAIDMCVKNRVESNKHLDDMKNLTETLAPNLKVEDIPVIRINNRVEEMAVRDLKGAVCDELGDNAPDPCKRAATVRLEVYYSPYNPKAIEFIKKQQKGNNEGIYELIDPKHNLPVEVDFIPWGVSTKTTDNKYDCTDTDEGCLAHRLHACIERHHDAGLLNHQEFNMIVCTTNHEDWTTNATISVIQCGNIDGLPVPDTGSRIVECATHEPESDLYLDEMRILTENLDPRLTEGDIPLIKINGNTVNNENNLRKLVCDALPEDLRPSDLCPKPVITSTPTPVKPTTEGGSSLMSISMASLVFAALVSLVVLNYEFL
ncbi:uncharacterized protein LOC128952173 [Oppia nitens]|uniref:uncharacterized protein LOC128952173 n=1 Tax=Oppia nitens TaxID=1686743 RepID=UPI0023DCD8C8|nr:uncharacterized protein LOC128952173 [Oppia nitens]